VITGRTVLLAGLGALAVPLWPTPLLGVAISAALLLAVCAVDWAMAGALRPLTLARTGARQVRLGQQAEVVLTVTNQGSRPVRAVLRDAWVPSAGATPPTHRLVVPPGGRGWVSTVLTPTRRGDRAAVAVVVRSVGPLGLAYRQPSARRSRRMTPPWSVRVLAPFESRRHLPEKLSMLRRVTGQLAIRGRGQGTEFDSLREYVDGDDVRSIDWRASARAPSTVVRTWRPERDRRVLCVIDTGRTAAARVHDVPRLDAALDACLLLGAVAARAGDQVDLLAADTAVRASVEGSRGRHVLPRLVQATALLEPALVETDFELVAAEVLRRERKRSLVVVFTALEAAPLAEGLLPVLPVLAARHTLILASVGDPTVAALRAGRGDVGAVYGAAAAETTIAERRRITRELGRYGVRVIDEPADVFASRVTDGYLALKAAGQL
jgi:uncharacterized protein (DUF58 family)